MVLTAIKRLSILLLFLVAMLAVPVFAFEEDDDEPLDLSPVKKGLGVLPTPAPTIPVTVPTLVATAVPTARPTPRPRPQKKLTNLTDLEILDSSQGIQLIVRGSGPVMGNVKTLTDPDRILLRIPDSTLSGRSLSRDINRGDAVRARVAQKKGEVWIVVDLLKPVKVLSDSGIRNGFGLTLLTGVKAPEREMNSAGMANLPKSNIMFFDLNVMFENEQFDRFPCANFIYDKGDKFPLEREFETTMVFFDGYGAFVGNVRIVDPQGKVIEQTRQPFAFNLFNHLTDFHVTLPWKLKFATKGFYKLFLTLNGEDVLTHQFYVGHNDDKIELSSK